MPLRAEFIENASKRPNVRLIVVWLLFAKLRREVVRRADDRVRHIVRLVELASNAQIANFNHILAR